MKAPPAAPHKIPPQTKRRVKGHAAVIYRAQKQVLGRTKSPDFLSGRRLGLPRPVLLRLVVSEASRLSRTNRPKVISLQEINAAVDVVQKQMSAKPAA